MRSACRGEAFYMEHEGKRYCVLHFPGVDKKPAFDIAVKRKLNSNDFNFEGVWFPSQCRLTNLDIMEPVTFRSSVFEGGAFFNKTLFRNRVDFTDAIFNDIARFEHTGFMMDVDFSSAIFQKDADFREARFEGHANFWRCTFNGRAEFYSAVFRQTASFWPAIFNATALFSHASFARANFRASEFKAKAVFGWCTFGYTEFTDASFSKDADFFSASFGDKAYFAHATFANSARFMMSEFNGEARFTSATFNEAIDFSHTIFKSLVGFSAEYGKGGFGSGAKLDFRHAQFETPRKVSFHSVTLRPHWFVNSDPREFQFIDVEWIGNLKRGYLDIEIGELKKRDELEEKEAADKEFEHLRTAEQYDDKFTIERLQRAERKEGTADADDRGHKQTRFYRLLAITCRQLAINAEENHRYEEASRFRYWAMDARRLEKWRGFAFWSLSWWYWAASGYGERIFRASLMLLGVWLVFAWLYTQVSFARPPTSLMDESNAVAKRMESEEMRGLPRALTYSFGVITLQKPDPRPETMEAQTLVTLETVLGPLQAALLALAIRRRFMR
jgi:hypothetical protein